MPKKIHTATGPNGEKFQRVSRSKTYSHVVIGRPSVAWSHKVSKDRIENDKRDFVYWAGRAAGENLSRWEVAEEVRANALAKMQGHTDAAEFAAARYAARQDAIHADKAKGYYDKFRALAWSSRYDLAARQLNAFVNCDDLRVIPCEVKQ